MATATIPRRRRKNCAIGRPPLPRKRERRPLLAGAHRSRRRFLLLLLLWDNHHSGRTVAAFSTAHVARLRKKHHLYYPRPRTTSLWAAFDPKEEIWPPTNEDTTIELSDSFIGGVRPAIVPRQQPSSSTTPFWLLLRAVPAGLLAAYCVPYILPIDGLFVMGFAGYVCVVAQWSKPSADGGGGGGLPTEPVAAGRLPLIDQPLGPRLSSIYDTWQALGGFLGLVLPWCLLVVAAASGGGVAASSTTLVARPLYLLACQVVTEAATHRFALPLRVLVSYVYSLLRLVYVYAWWTATEVSSSAADLLSVPSLSHWLAGAVLVHALVHVVAVLPVVALRFLRVHFFLVEAASVELRPGMEASIGLSPSPSSFEE